MTSDSIQRPQEGIQEEIIQSFLFLEGDREAMLHYLIEIGEQLPALADEHKVVANQIPGCMSTVWLICHEQGGRLFFTADSNTVITKGLIGLLVRILSGQPIATILTTELYFIEKIGMQHLLGAQRIGGLVSMIQQIKKIASKCQSINEANKGTDYA